MPIDNLDEALRDFQNKTGFRRIRFLYKKDIKLGAVFMRPEKPFEKYAVTFKRDWYKDFGFHFPKCPDRGRGQITSLNLLLYCEKEHIAYVVAVMPNGVAYKIVALEFLNYYRQHHTSVLHLPGEVASPIKMWIRLYPKLP